jgi:hypothetical protein
MTRAPPLANASHLEQRPPLASPPDCCCSRRLRRPVPRHCESGVPPVCGDSIARVFRWAGTDGRAQSARKCRKQGQIRLLKGVLRRALHAITRPPASLRDPRALAFPLEQYFLTDRMRVFVKGGDVRVCPRGGSDVNMKNGVYLHTLRAHPRAIRAVFLPRFLGSHQHYHRP